MHKIPANLGNGAINNPRLSHVWAPLAPSRFKSKRNGTFINTVIHKYAAFTIGRTRVSPSHKRCP